MIALTKVKIVRVPNVEELNAILFDIQQERINIVKVDYMTTLPDGSMYFSIQYHANIDADLSKLDEEKEEPVSEEE
jgi:hypothetical protein